MRQRQVLELFTERLLPEFVAESLRVDALDMWLRKSGDEIPLPRKASKEHRTLAGLARTPLLPLVITNTAQALHVDGYEAPDPEADRDGWETWQANGMESRQSAIHRAALGHGVAYATVMPGFDRNGRRAVIRGVSARKMVTLWQDSAEDDWPMYAMRRDSAGTQSMWRIFDEDNVYYISTDADHTRPEFIEWREHGAGVCPVVRYANLLDLEGTPESDIEQLIPLAARFNKTVYDRLLVQHFNSWKVRTIAGLQEFADDEVEAERKKIKLAQDDILIAEDADTKFGTLDETPLSGFIEAEQEELTTLSAVAQVPSTAMSGKVANLSADAIAELRAGLTQKVFERQTWFGSSHAQTLSLARRLEGKEEPPVASRMQWRDMQPRTMAQVVDALGKAATMLEVPPQAVWHLIPGFSRDDVEDMKAEANRGRASAARQALAEAAAAVRGATGEPAAG